jgi:hypothetical protein
MVGQVRRIENRTSYSGELEEVFEFAFSPLVARLPIYTQFRCGPISAGLGTRHRQVVAPPSTTMIQKIA